MTKAIAGIASLLLCAPIFSRADTWEVPQEAPTISAALALCSAGDTVLVADGTYSGTGNRNITLPSFDVVVRSSGGADDCTIDLEGQGRWLEVRNGLTRATVIEGFRVIHGHETLGGGIAITYGSPLIQNCAFEGNYALGGAAILSLGPDPLVRNCVFLRNETSSTGHGGAAYIGSLSVLPPAIFENCVFHHNRAAVGGAVYAETQTTVRFVNCTISGNVAYWEGGGITTSSAQLDLRNTVVYGNVRQSYGADEIDAINQTIEPQCCDFRMAGMEVEGWTFQDCIDADPLFCDAAGWETPDYPSDYHLRSDSPCLPQYSPCGALIGALDQGCLAPTLGACCLGLECRVLTASECSGQGGVFLQEGLDCEPNPCTAIPVVPTTWGRIKTRYR